MLKFLSLILAGVMFSGCAASKYQQRAEELKAAKADVVQCIENSEALRQAHEKLKADYKTLQDQYKVLEGLVAVQLKK